LRFDQYRYPTSDAMNRTSPRVNAVYQFDSGTEIRAAWGTVYQGQNVSDLQVEDGVTTFFEPERVTQYLLGLNQPLNAAWSLRLDLYQKDYDHLRPRFENAVDQIELIPEATIDRVRIDAREARAQGVELTVRREVPGSWGGYLSYGYGIAEDHDPDAWRARSWDQRQNVSAGFHYGAENWSFSLAGLYHSGTATTKAHAYVATVPDGSQRVMWAFDDRNAGRFPSFLRIDARLAHESHLKSGTLSYYVEVINLLGRQNVCCVNDYTAQMYRGAPELDTEYSYWLPRLPSFGFQFEF
jgi:outer membrane receptor protein involved in Fe transport